MLAQKGMNKLIKQQRKEQQEDYIFFLLLGGAAQAVELPRRKGGTPVTWLVALSASRGPTLSGTVCPSPPTPGDPVRALRGRLRYFWSIGNSGTDLVVLLLSLIHI